MNINFKLYLICFTCTVFGVYSDLMGQFPESIEFLPTKNKYLTFRDYDASKDAAIIKFNLKAMQKFKLTVSQIDLAALYELPFKYVYLGGNKKETVFYESGRDDVTVNIARKFAEGGDEEYKTFVVKEGENSNDSFILLVKHVPNYYKLNSNSFSNENRGNYYWILNFSELTKFDLNRKDLLKKLYDLEISLNEFNENYKSEKFKLSSNEVSNYKNFINNKIFENQDSLLQQTVFYHFTRSKKYDKGVVILSKERRALNDGSVNYSFQMDDIKKYLIKNLNYNDIKTGKTGFYSQHDLSYRDNPSYSYSGLKPMLTNFNGLDTIYEVYSYFTREPKTYQEFYSEKNPFAIRERRKFRYEYPGIEYDNLEFDLLNKGFTLMLYLDKDVSRLAILFKEKEIGMFSANRGWLVNSLDSAYKYYVLGCDDPGAKRFYAKKDAEAEAEKKAAEEREKVVKELSVKYGRRYVEAALEGRILVGMHEDLVSFQINRFWYKSSQTLGTTSAYYLKPMNTIMNPVIIYVKNKKVISVSNW